MTDPGLDGPPSSAGPGGGEPGGSAALSRRRLMTGVAAAVLAAPALPVAATARPALPGAPVDITVRSFPINAFAPGQPTKTVFGRLEYLGGLELQSDHRGFGGISSIRTDATGQRLTAITDKGQWLTARIDMEGRKPAGLSQARMAAILGPNGRPLADTGNWDTEALWIEGGTAYVAVERTHRIFRFDTFGRDGLTARGVASPVPMGDRRLSGNRGIEALGVLPRPSPLAGTLIGISERGLNDQGDIRGFLFTPTPREFFVKRTNEFDITDLAFLPNGDLLILERWFSVWRGLGVRIRRIDAANIRPGATLDGPIVMSADLSAQIDNMEGLAVHRDGNGDTILTLVSDNNFSFLQRTLLLQFAYRG
ncbi:esterase-like activity of phytase family protein [Phreatobacter stygius]|uniref:Twin-arginine translocation pathway signal n=1 Tax=Phreatobacter stygius TaxID=1940610 RepID=A0A4D7B4K9_9HYPH|nr:esterase-like activity of phytase family protein [Phreatobacter stygius]QCI64616.1 twin-arginine translocation pathway signal [Phreatobacter stygius]